jgi:hypothetical protein
MSALAPYRKAILAFFVAAIPVLLSNIGGDGIKLQDWLQALAAGVVGLGAVYSIRNEPLEPTVRGDGRGR